jgi:tetratricopeptide (TPR) repeat protein
MRYRLLETLKAYAAERLRESGNATKVTVQHAQHYEALARRMETQLYSQAQLQARREFDIEHNNFRAVLANASVSDEVARAAVHIAASISLCWFFGNYFSEARHRLEWILSFPAVLDDPDAARCLVVDGFRAASLGDHAIAMGMCERALAQARNCGDAFALAYAHFGLAATSFICGNALEMERAARDGVQASTEAKWAWGVAICRAYLGRSLLMQRRVSEAVEELTRAVDDSAAAGDPFTRALSLSFHGAALGMRDYTQPRCRSNDLSWRSENWAVLRNNRACWWIGLLSRCSTGGRVTRAEL